MAKLKRRQFVTRLSAASLALPVAGLETYKNIVESRIQDQISNSYFTVGLSPETGRIYLRRADGTLLSQAVSQSAETSAGRIHFTKYLKNKTVSSAFTSLEGRGRELLISSEDTATGILAETRFRLYDEINCFSAETKITNPGKKEMAIGSIEPLVFATENGGGLAWKGAEKVLTNGAMYYDAGMIHEPGEKYTEPEPYGPVKSTHIVPGFGLKDDEVITSWWNIAFFSGYNSETPVIGFPENRKGFGRIVMSNSSSGEYTLYCSARFSEGFSLKPGESTSSAKVFFLIGSNPYSALELYGSLLGKVNSVKKPEPINGWCSWFYTYEFVTEKEVLRNARFVSGELKSYGLDYIQVDEGYQAFHGEWEANERFPSGLKALAENIKMLGLKPGIWLAPFVISEQAPLFREHSEWLLRDNDGSLMRVGPWPDIGSEWARTEAVKRYGLDISHPGAQKWLYDLFRKLSFDYGFEMFKIDFVAWSVLSAKRFYDSSYTPAFAYRKGMEIIRSAIGEGKHINDCGPGFITAGLIDSMRIEIDQNYGFSDAAWKQYFTDSSSSAPAAAKRYFFHNKTWINDADHLCINSLTPGQAMSVASLISLTGGNIISGDRLFDLDQIKLEILKKTLPSYGIAARPADLFDSDRQSVFALEVRKPFGNWTIAGFFNGSTVKPLRKEIEINRLFLDPDKKYLVFDFWNGVLYSEPGKTIVRDINPGECSLLSIHENRGHPWVISTDRHILQGAIETVALEWDAQKSLLSGISAGIPGTSYNLFIWFPDGAEWKQDKRLSYSDSDDYSIRIAGRNLMKMRLYFNSKSRVSWSVSFSEKGLS